METARTRNKESDRGQRRAVAHLCVRCVCCLCSLSGLRGRHLGDKHLEKRQHVPLQPLVGLAQTGRAGEQTDGRVKNTEGSCQKKTSSVDTPKTNVKKPESKGIKTGLETEENQGKNQ